MWLGGAVLVKFPSQLLGVDKSPSRLEPLPARNRLALLLAKAPASRVVGVFVPLREAVGVEAEVRSLAVIFASGTPPLHESFSELASLAEPKRHKGRRLQLV